MMLMMLMMLMILMINIILIMLVTLMTLKINNQTTQPGSSQNDSSRPREVSEGEN